MEAVRVLLLPPGTLACLSLVDLVAPGLLRGSSLAFLSPRNQSSFASALASFHSGNWMPIISVLDECPTYSTAVGTGFLLLSFSSLSPSL